MAGIAQPALFSDRPMPREVVLTLLDSALRTGELRYARRLCGAWLAIYPGDLQVKLINAQAFGKEQSPSLKTQALPLLEELVSLDPEFQEAQQLLAEISESSSPSTYPVAKACSNALSHGLPVTYGADGQVSSWPKYVHEARFALEAVRAGDYQQVDKAEYYIHKALVENPNTPLAAVIHLRLMASKGTMPKMAVRSLAQIYHERWPDCVQFLLTFANELMALGETGQAVSMLHEAVTKDTAGQVAKRMWGERHQYTSMWPTRLEARNTYPNSPHNLPIPAAVASSLGWNQIAPGLPGFYSSETEQAGSIDSKPREYLSEPFLTQEESRMPVMSNGSPGTAIGGTAQLMQDELERMAKELNRPHIAHEDGRFPVYVVFTTLEGLNAQYGEVNVQEVHAELRKLTTAIQGQKINHEFWGSLLFYADDATCTAPFNLKPAAYNDAWQLKTTLADLDKALDKRGERIGAVLIVGGPEIVPFHNLPNPVEDADSSVPSDNPYAAKDNNYFISDWPVGRVSGGEGKDAGNLLLLLKDITDRYDKNGKKPSWFKRLLQNIREFLRKGLAKKLSSFGYTAAVWRRASLSVFKPIGTPNDMLISPPVHAPDEPNALAGLTKAPPMVKDAGSHLSMPDTQLAYFNLHGVPDSSEWYGQSDPELPEAGPEFPVAMRPQDIRNGGSAPRLVFTEACYGANITGKTVDDAISLKFLVSGTQAVVGSTCISYGSLATPLAADLLGIVFWNLLQEGFTVGESFRRSKIHLTREMNQRQGFLDAEDQKTLISFVLFGDPLAQPFKTRVSPKVTPHLSDDAVFVPTVCERSCEGIDETEVSLETIAHLKSVVAQYLPGMDDAEVRLSHQHQRCSKGNGNCGCGKKCQFSRIPSKTQSGVKPQRHVVTLSKNFEKNAKVHTQYARLTLDEGGKIVKMVVSH